ncbi:uncharacterized protein LOC120520899 isoform X1 [Polypterus senegalus]|uniref:uncharacterized protein LOC120520899 isoform X1 n=1 Tax=Polypterus senegalus TaxID=55291 RepID=UPI0019645175|nr:uncharacterized protein LOC120520899 isoform X1 [Polypterus senegalus]
MPAIFQLLENITVLDLNIEADPGELVVKSTKAIPILKDQAGAVLMAATEYGKGRMVVFGHEAYLKEPNIQMFICNCVKWLKSNSNAVVGIPKYCESVASILTAAGHKVKISDKFDSSMGVFFVNGQEQISQLPELTEFIKGGGGVMIGAQAWCWCSENPGKDPLAHFPANKLTGLADIYFGPNKRPRGYFTIHMTTSGAQEMVIKTTQHMPTSYNLLENITHLDLNFNADPGELVVKSSKAIPILKDQTGAVLMAATEYGKGRMVVFGHEQYLMAPQLHTLVCNCVRWMKSNPDAVVGLPKFYEGVASILTAAGHKVKISDKFDSSMGVFFVNGQEQISQLPELTEFIKGGGGVMIGAQAWCWCSENPGKDPLAHFPANKLTGLADIYFGPNKRPRGYYTIHTTTSEAPEKVIKTTQHMPTSYNLLENITHLDLNFNADPGELVVKSTKAIPILKDQTGAVLMAATEYGKGRMVVFGHEQYLMAPQLHTLVSNCVRWMKSNPDAVVGLPKFYEGVASILTAAGHKVKISDKFDSSMGVFFVNGQEQISQLPELTEFIKGGGGVMIGAQAWCWCSENPGKDPLAHFPANKLTGLADIYFGPNKRPRGYYTIHTTTSEAPEKVIKTTQHMPTSYNLLENITHLDLNFNADPGELVVKSTKAIPILKDQTGAVLMAATEYGKGRMVVFGHEQYLMAPQLHTLVSNCVRWMKSNPDAVVGLPKFYEGVASILTAAGHKVKISDKFDSSMGVFFVNGQEQISQLPELTEFIKGGGGVMIGAQAWCWCSENPGKDPLAHFPANKLTGLADIYFGPNKRPRGYYTIHTTTSEAPEKVIKTTQHMPTSYNLLENITHLDLNFNADPGELVVKSTKAIPILKDQTGAVLMAATEYGKGRMVVFGHEQYLMAPQLHTLVSNCVRWMKSNPDAVVGLPKFYEGVASILTAAGHKVKISDKFDSSMGVFFVNGQEQISQLPELTEFIKGGGGVMIGAQAWCWCSENPGKDPLAHFPANKLTGLADIYFGPNKRPRGYYTIHTTTSEAQEKVVKTTQHMPTSYNLLENITHLDLNFNADPGELVVKSTKAIPILKDQTGAVLMAATEYGKGRMVVFGHEQYLMAPQLHTLVSNCVRWMKSNPDAVVGLPKFYEGVASILTAAGHKVKISDKFDSSMGVFFVNGQEQISQLPELTEFIKGGGGVMIGAQAWCWCSENPGKDPLAHFPANKLTGLADIYFGPNKRPRGYYTIHTTTSEAPEKVIKTTQHMPTSYNLLENITHLDLNFNADPGELVVKSTKAIPILKDQTGAVLMAATEYGKGRMVVFGHEQYLMAPQLHTLVSNCVRWMKSNPDAVVGLPKFYEGVASILTAAGHKVKISDKFDSSMGVFFVNGQEQISQLPELTEFIKGGGGVMIGAQAWCWCSENPGKDPLAHFPANKLTGLADIYFGPNKRPRGYYTIHTTTSEAPEKVIKTTQHMPTSYNLLENITHLDLNFNADPGELVVKSTKAIPILKDQTGAVLMAATEYGKGRMVVFGHEQYLMAPQLHTLVSNCVRWMKSNPDAVVGLPKFYEGVASILTAAGHKVKISDKFDNSMGVFFVNGQEQISQLPELTEFIKGGGGVMIGAQAWCWCSENPGKDPLAHFPANKLTGLADIYFGPNKRPGILYNSYNNI